MDSLGTQVEELMKLLQSLALNWGDVFDSNKLKDVRLCGGNTDVVYRVTWPRNTNENDERAVLVRIYGEAMHTFLDREEEIRNFEVHLDPWTWSAFTCQVSSRPSGGVHSC